MTQGFLWLCDYNVGDLVVPSDNSNDLQHIIAVLPAKFSVEIHHKSQFRVDAFTGGSADQRYVYVTLLDDELIPVSQSIGGFYACRFRKCQRVVTSTRRLTVKSVRCRESEGS